MGAIKVVVDVHERRSGIPRTLERLGAEVVVQSLAVGDYDVGANTLVERKSMVDLLLSLQRGRFWRQVAAVRRCSRFPVLLIEGPPPETVLGAATARGLRLAVSDQGVVVLTSRTSVESAHWIADLARRRQVHVPRDRPPYAVRQRTPTGHPGEPLLCAIPQVSVHHARALLDGFGSVRNVVAASREDWMSIRGIGPRRADSMSLCFGPDGGN